MAKKKSYTQLEIGFIIHGADCPKAKSPRKKCTCGVLMIADQVQGWIDNINADNTIQK